MPSVIERMIQQPIFQKARKASSIATKGIKNPTEAAKHTKYRLEYIRILLTGKDPESISFYSDLQNKKVRAGEAYPRGRGIGEAQIEFLQRQGLDPSDRVLEIGCGDLRGGRHLISYLNKGNYTGMDISEEAVKQGWITLRSYGLMDKTPSLLVNDDLKLDEFENQTFERIFANSVLTHLPEEQIAELFSNLEEVLSPNGQACLSYHQASEHKAIKSNNISSSNLYKFPFEQLRNLGEEHGLRVGHDTYHEHPVERMQMLCICVDT